MARMEILKVKNGKLSVDGLGKTLNALMAGEVVMHATETCYGLAVDIFNEDALKKLYALKKMSLDKPVSIMVSGLDEAQKYAEFNEVALSLAKKFWPGPVTLVLPRKDSLPEFLNAGHATVGLRCPDHAVSQLLVKKYGGPLSTTSANISGVPQVYCIEDYEPQLAELNKSGSELLEPAFALDEGKIAENLPSTIIGFKDGKSFIIREGDMVKEVKVFLQL